MCGIVLLAWMMWRLFFVPEPVFDNIALAVALSGISAAWLLQRLRVRPRIDAAVVIYATLAALSAILHGGPLLLADYVNASRPLIVVSYFYGATMLLSGEARLGILIVAFAAAISLIGAGGAYDSVLSTAHGNRLQEYPSVGQWNGYAEVGLLLVVAWPLFLAVLALSRRIVALASAALLAAVLLTLVWMIDARAPYVAIAATLVVQAGVQVVWFRRVRLLAIAAVGAGILAAILVIHGDWRDDFRQGWKDRFTDKFADQVRPGSFGFESAFGRPDAWRPALRLIRDHPWLGVGPGHYTSALRAAGYIGVPTVDHIHAHSMMLQVAAESGVPAAFAFLATWWSVLGGLRRRCGNSPHTDLLALALGGALVAYFIRNLGDHFTSGIFTTSDRIEFFLWTLFAASSALIRSPASIVST